MEPTEFVKAAIRPTECLSAGWRLIKGQYLLVVGMSLVGILLGSLAPLGVLLGPMMCGLYMALLALMRGERVEFALLFKGFDHFLQSMIATLVAAAPVMVAMVPGYVVVLVLGFLAGHSHGQGGPPVTPAVLISGVAAFVLLLLALSLAVHVFLLFSYLLIVDRGLSGWEACKTSSRAARGNLGGIVGLVLLNFLLGLAGTCLCYVGAFFIVPICLAANAVAYRRVFPAAS